MARPVKYTVDYFPHQCKHGKTMFIIEQRYGIAGYAFWFKLLERLGSTDGHFIDCRNVSEWEFLQAITQQTPETCTEILDLLSKLDAIDRDLWAEKVIWCQNFVDGISEVYKNRRVEMPAKPSFYDQKPSDAAVSTDEKPQSRVKESRVKESKEEEEDETGTAARSRVTPSKMSDEEWLSHLQGNSAYEGLDIPTLYQKMLVWCETNGKQPTRKRFVNWLNREDKPMKGTPKNGTGSGSNQQSASQPGKYAGRETVI